MISEGSTPLALPGGNPAARRGGALMQAKPPDRPRRIKRKIIPQIASKAFAFADVKQEKAYKGGA